MNTIEANTLIRNEEQQAGIITMPARQAQTFVVPVIRRLPHAYAMMHNLSVNESVNHPARNVGDVKGDLYIKVNRIYKRIKLKDIYLVEGLCDYVRIYTKEKRYALHSTMYGILEKLPEKEFMRVHRSYIIRLDCISAFENNAVVIDTRRIPIGKTYKNDVISGLNIIQEKKVI